MRHLRTTRCVRRLVPRSPFCRFSSNRCSRSFAVSRHAVLIADEVGLGKTVQAGLIISELLERRPDSHVLVVTPAGLRHQWQAELRERFRLDATLLDSTSIARHAAQGNGNPWSMPGVVLTSLDYVKRPEVVRALEALVWDRGGVRRSARARRPIGSSDSGRDARAASADARSAHRHAAFGRRRGIQQADVTRRLLWPVSDARVPTHAARCWPRHHPTHRLASSPSDAARIGDARRPDGLCATGLETVSRHHMPGRGSRWPC